MLKQVFQPLCVSACRTSRLCILLQSAYLVVSAIANSQGALYAHPHRENRAATNEIILKVRSPASLSSSLVIMAIKNAMARSGCKCSGEPMLHQLNEVGSLEATSGPAGCQSKDAEESSAELDLAIESVDPHNVRFPVTVKLTIKEPSSWALKVELKYSPRDEEVVSTADTTRVMALGCDSSGRERYLLRLPRLPLALSMLVSYCPFGDESDRTLDWKWPTVTTYLIAKLDGFEGDINQLKSALVNNKGSLSSSHPVASPSEGEESRYIIPLDITFDGIAADSQRMVTAVYVPVASNADIERVWIKAPISQEQIADELLALRSLATGDQVAEHICQASDMSRRPNMSRELHLGEKAKWFELAPRADGSAFQACFVADMSGQKRLEVKMNKMFMLVVPIKKGVNKTEAVLVDDESGPSFVVMESFGVANCLVPLHRKSASGTEE